MARVYAQPARRHEVRRFELDPQATAAGAELAAMGLTPLGDWTLQRAIGLRVHLRAFAEPDGSAYAGVLVGLLEGVYVEWTTHFTDGSSLTTSGGDFKHAPRPEGSRLERLPGARPARLREQHRKRVHGLGDEGLGVERATAGELPGRLLAWLAATDRREFDRLSPTAYDQLLADADHRRVQLTLFTTIRDVEGQAVAGLLDLFAAHRLDIVTWCGRQFAAQRFRDRAKRLWGALAARGAVSAAGVCEGGPAAWSLSFDLEVGTTEHWREHLRHALPQGATMALLTGHEPRWTEADRLSLSPFALTVSFEAPSDCAWLTGDRLRALSDGLAALFGAVVVYAEPDELTGADWRDGLHSDAWLQVYGPEAVSALGSESLTPARAPEPQPFWLEQRDDGSVLVLMTPEPWPREVSETVGRAWSAALEPTALPTFEPTIRFGVALPEGDGDWVESLREEGPVEQWRGVSGFDASVANLFVQAPVDAVAEWLVANQPGAKLATGGTVSWTGGPRVVLRLTGHAWTQVVSSGELPLLPEQAARMSAELGTPAVYYRCASDEDSWVEGVVWARYEGGERTERVVVVPWPVDPAREAATREQLQADLGLDDATVAALARLHRPPITPLRLGDGPGPPGSAALVELRRPVPVPPDPEPYHLVDALLADEGSFELGADPVALSAGVRGQYRDYRLQTRTWPWAEAVVWVEAAPP